MTIEEAIRQSYIAQGLSNQDIQLLISLCHVRAFDSGDTVITMDEPGQELMILLEGSLDVETMFGDTIAGMKPGSIFGELSVVEGGKRTANVMATGPTTVAVISGDRLLKEFEANPNLGMVIMRNICRLLSERLRSSNRQLGAVLALY